MPMLSSDDLEYMRTAIEQLLPDTCYILSSTLTADGAGGMTESWGTAGTADCRLDAKSGQELLLGESARPVFSYVLTLPHSATITEANRVEVGDSTFSVTSVDTDKSWAACVRAYLERT